MGPEASEEDDEQREGLEPRFDEHANPGGHAIPILDQNRDKATRNGEKSTRRR